MHGGKRNGAGRPKGAIGERSRALIEEAEATGEMPIAYMLRVMRTENISSLRRDAMAKAAAAYLYPRITPVMEPEPVESESIESSAATNETTAHREQ